jgi:integrase
MGTAKELQGKSQARKAAMSWVFSMNAKGQGEMPATFGALVRRYLAEEIPERHSTASRYRCWLKNHIEPKWRDFPIGHVKPLRASHRWMPLDQSLAEVLRHYRSACCSIDTDEWLFANPQTGKPYWPGRIQENWLVPAAEKAGIGRIGWRTFSHSHSTLLHSLGVDLKVQQELLRHADARTTLNIYTQTVPAALREANSKVVRLVLASQVA